MTIETLKDIVRRASSRMDGDDFKVMMKDGCENIVTSSDIAVQDFLKDSLSRQMAGSGFLCEEEDVHDTAHDCLWIIDPIDGTANYARGIAQCAICVGLCSRGVMQMSVVYLPRTGEMFWAELGKGAFLNDSRIHVSDRQFGDSVMSTAMPVYHKEYTDVCSEIIKDVFLQANDIRRFGAAAPELCYLACGRTELYFEYMLSPWDFAAASLIVTEAGGVLATPRGGCLRPATPSGVVAANSKANLERLLDIVEVHLPG